MTVREYLLKCLETQSRSQWSEEGVTVARHRLAVVLRVLGEHKEAEDLEREVSAVRERYLSQYPEFLQESVPGDPHVYDLMISIYAGRLTTRQGGGHPMYLR